MEPVTRDLLGSALIILGISMMVYGTVILIRACRSSNRSS